MEEGPRAQAGGLGRPSGCESECDGGKAAWARAAAHVEKCGVRDVKGIPVSISPEESVFDPEALGISCELEQKYRRWSEVAEPDLLLRKGVGANKVYVSSGRASLFSSKR